jgi:hypothetical protein
MYGCLDNFSEFKFENFLGGLKRKIHSGYLPLQQIASRLQPVFQREDQHCVNPHELHYNGPLLPNPDSNFSQFTSIEIGSRCLRLNSTDCFFSIKNGQIFKLVNILQAENRSAFSTCCAS